MMTIWECKRCLNRYGQLEGREVSSCPKCKSVDRVILSEAYHPVVTLDPDRYMSLWRLSSLNEQVLLDILQAGQATKISECPACSTSAFAHHPDCWLGALCLTESNMAMIEVKEFQRGDPIVNATGSIRLMRCDRCNGTIQTVQQNPGSLPNSHVCRASMGCRGNMFFEDTPRKLDPQNTKWSWVRLADLDGASPERIHNILREGMLDLVRLPLAD